MTLCIMRVAGPFTAAKRRFLTRRPPSVILMPNEFALPHGSEKRSVEAAKTTREISAHFVPMHS